MASCWAAAPEVTNVNQELRVQLGAGKVRSASLKARKICKHAYFLTEPSVKNACTHNTSVPLWLLRNACSLGVKVPLCFKKDPAEASGDQAEALHNMYYFYPSLLTQPTHPASSVHRPPHRESLLSVYFFSLRGQTEPTSDT